MNKKMIIVLLGILAMFSLVLSGCNGPIAGQAIKTTSDLNKGETILLGVSPNVIDVLEYKGADTSSTRSGKVKFKSLRTGDIINFPIENGQITITVGGESHTAKLTNPNSIDSPLQVDYYGSTNHQLARLHWY